ncbi:hypothetical protein [Streptomyces sp. NPDC005989]|uniref:hypothetical protein n=1 Tax=unclassified Streptomyces TaxID=2593676 RepID=UPI00340C2564
MHPLLAFEEAQDVVEVMGAVANGMAPDTGQARALLMILAATDVLQLTGYGPGARHRRWNELRAVLMSCC